MLHIEDEYIREHLLQGKFGLEQESLRITRDGHFAHTPHPFAGETHIDRDFSENQVEINTSPAESAEAAMHELGAYRRHVLRVLAELEEPELLWPFSNPPYIRNERDIHIAQFGEEEKSREAYREYLSDRYGRYKMTYSGIHVNYSFDEALLKRDFSLYGTGSYRDYKDRFYLDLAQRAITYGWLLVAVTAASPLMDATFVEKGGEDKDLFCGIASVRTSEMGYWNYFTPVFDYTDIESYADGIQRYITEGYLIAPSELYYPIRLKPPGKNDLRTLKEKGVDHIELRMYDLNPLAEDGLDLRDVQFGQLFLVWLACGHQAPLAPVDQVNAAQNIKNAAHYDLKTVKIVYPDGRVENVIRAGLHVMEQMTVFYRGWPGWVQDVLAFETAKFHDLGNRYAQKVAARYGGGYVRKGLQLAEALQQRALQREDTQQCASFSR